MGRLEKIRILNSLLLEEMPGYRQQAEQFAQDLESQRRLLRSLMNVRYPGKRLNPEFLLCTAYGGAGDIGSCYTGR